MTPIQQLMLGVGASKKTYMDDVFSTYVYKGNSTAGHSIINGIDLSKGGLTWIKNRSTTGDNWVFDTARGATNYIKTNSTNSAASDSGLLTAFNDNGFTLGNDGSTNASNQNFASWTFRKAPGFFDVVTYTGNGSTRTMSHSLGSVPGCIMVKCTSHSEDWSVYHRSALVGSGLNPAGNYLVLNSSAAAVDHSSRWADTAPTSTHFTVAGSSTVNENSKTYVAYLFAGGESTAATARSIDVDANGDYFQTSTGSDYTFGTGDFTIEGWFWPETTNDRGLFMQAPTGSTGIQTSYAFQCNVNTTLRYRLGSGSTTGSTTQDTGVTMPIKQWSHVAFVRSSGVFSIYFNGTLVDTQNDTTNYNSTDLIIGGYDSTNYLFDGKISNFRVVKGTAVYTSSFRVPTEPLTNISGTVLLFCNNSSVTGTTTGTVTSSGNPTASTDSPFDDPAAHVFGESGSESVIKTGSFVGNGSSTGPEINLGWEPQWILTKNSSRSDNWMMFDSMRGIVSGDDDEALYPNLNNAKSDDWQHLDITPTGFKIKSNNGDINANGETTIFIAIRRSDGYCGKPAELGTGVFAMDLGNSSTTQAFTSGFPVDLGIAKAHNASGDWETMARLIQGRYLITNGTQAGAGFANATFDDNTGFLHGNNGYTSDRIGYMWKRHAGFDVVAWVGEGVNRQMPHSLARVPEMIWVKRRDNAADWSVYHKWLNGGTDAENYHLHVNTTAAEYAAATMWNDSAPTATHFNIGSHPNVNANNGTYIAMLFSSVDGISKVGSFSGQTGSDLTIELGFTPRFFMAKRIDAAGHGWYVLDTTRGLVSGNDKVLLLNSNAAQFSGDYADPTSSGITLAADYDTSLLGNSSSHKHIYYAHA